MKKVLLASFALFSVVFSFAQNTSFGIRGGLASSRLEGDAVRSINELAGYTNGIISTRPNNSFYVGAYASKPLSERVYVEPALYYTQKGYAIDGGIAMKAVKFLGINAGAALNAQYVDLPIMIKANFNGLEIFGGPQLSYLTKATFKTSAGVMGINLLNNKMDLTHQFNRWDAGATAGIGYRFANGVNFSIAYDHGLMKTDRNQNMESYNRTFRAGIGFRL